MLQPFIPALLVDKLHTDLSIFALNVILAFIVLGRQKVMQKRYQ